MTTNTMTIELASLIIRRKAQNEWEWVGMNDSLACLARAGWSLEDVAKEARRTLSDAEEIVFHAAKVK